MSVLKHVLLQTAFRPSTRHIFRFFVSELWDFIRQKMENSRIMCFSAADYFNNFEIYTFGIISFYGMRIIQQLH